MDTLFPFSQVALRRAAVSLEPKTEVEVIPIHMARRPDPAANCPR